MTVKHTDSIRKADIPVDRLSDEGKCLLAAEEEANAISTYLNMAENSDGALKESFEEVADDEAEHLGKVLSAVSSIRPELLEGMMNGVQESEDEGFDIDGAITDRINAKTEKPSEVDFDREIESAIRKSLKHGEDYDPDVVNRRVDMLMSLYTFCNSLEECISDAVGDTQSTEFKKAAKKLIGSEWVGLSPRISPILQRATSKAKHYYKSKEDKLLSTKRTLDIKSEYVNKSIKEFELWVENTINSIRDLQVNEEYKKRILKDMKEACYDWREKLNEEKEKLDEAKLENDIDIYEFNKQFGQKLDFINKTEKYITDNEKTFDERKQEKKKLDDAYAEEEKSRKAKLNDYTEKQKSYQKKYESAINEVKQTVKKEMKRLNEIFNEKLAPSDGKKGEDDEAPWGKIKAWGEIGVTKTKDDYREQSYRSMNNDALEFQNAVEEYVLRKSPKVAEKIKDIAKKYGMRSSELIDLYYGTDHVSHKYGLEQNGPDSTSGSESYSSENEGMGNGDTVGLKQALKNLDYKLMGKTKTPMKRVGESQMEYQDKVAAARMLGDDVYYPEFRGQVNYNPFNLNVEAYPPFVNIAKEVFKIRKNFTGTVQPEDLQYIDYNIAFNLLSFTGKLFGETKPTLPYKLSISLPEGNRLYGGLYAALSDAQKYFSPESLWSIYGGYDSPVSLKEFKSDPLNDGFFGLSFVRNALDLFTDRVRRGIITLPSTYNHNTSTTEEEKILKKIHDGGRLTLGDLNKLLTSELKIRDGRGKGAVKTPAEYIVNLINDNNPYIDVFSSDGDVASIYEVDVNNLSKLVKRMAEEYEMQDIIIPPAFKDGQLRDNLKVMYKLIQKGHDEKETVTNEDGTKRLILPINEVYLIASGTEKGRLKTEQTKSKRHDLISLLGMKDGLERVRKTLLINELLKNGGGKNKKFAEVIDTLSDGDRKFGKLSHFSTEELQEMANENKRSRKEIKFINDCIKFRNNEEKVIGGITDTIIKKVDKGGDGGLKSIRLINDLLNYISDFEIDGSGNIYKILKRDKDGKPIKKSIVDFGDRRYKSTFGDNTGLGNSDDKFTNETDISILGKKVPIYNLANSGFLSMLEDVFEASDVSAFLPMDGELTGSKALTQDIAKEEYIKNPDQKLADVIHRMIDRRRRGTSDKKAIEQANDDRRNGYYPMTKYMPEYEDYFPVENKGDRKILYFTNNLNEENNSRLKNYPLTSRYTKLMGHFTPGRLHLRGGVYNDNVFQSWLKRLQFGNPPVEYTPYDAKIIRNGLVYSYCIDPARRTENNYLSNLLLFSVMASKYLDTNGYKSMLPSLPNKLKGYGDLYDIFSSVMPHEEDFRSISEYHKYLESLEKFAVDTVAVFVSLDSAANKGELEQATELIDKSRELSESIPTLFEPSESFADEFNKSIRIAKSAGIYNSKTIKSMISDNEDYRPNKSSGMTGGLVNFIKTVNKMTGVNSIGTKSASNIFKMYDLGTESAAENIANRGDLSEREKIEAIQDLGIPLRGFSGLNGKLIEFGSDEYKGNQFDLLTDMIADELLKDYNRKYLTELYNHIKTKGITGFTEDSKDYSMVKAITMALEKVFEEDFVGDESNPAKIGRISRDRVPGDRYEEDILNHFSSMDDADTLLAEMVGYIIEGRKPSEREEEDEDAIGAAGNFLNTTGKNEVDEDTMRKVMSYGDRIVFENTDPKVSHADMEGADDAILGGQGEGFKARVVNLMQNGSSLGDALKTVSDTAQSLRDKIVDERDYIHNTPEFIAQAGQYPEDSKITDDAKEIYDIGHRKNASKSDETSEPTESSESTDSTKKSVSHMKEIAKSRIIDSTVEQTPVRTTSSHPIWQPTDYVMPLGDPRNHQIGDEISVKRDQPDGTKTEVWDIDEEIKKRQK